MRKILIALLLLSPASLFGQELKVEGGDVTIVVTPDTVLITDTLVLPPDTIEVPVPCPECPPVCPEGWTCEPPPEPDGPTIQVTSIQGEWGEPDSVEAGGYYIRLDSQEWSDAMPPGCNDCGPVPGVSRVEFSIDGEFSNRESLYPYEVNPRLTDLVPGEVLLETVVTGDSIYTVVKRIVVTNSNTPPVPPDTVPTEPGDTTAYPEAKLLLLEVDGVLLKGNIQNDTILAGEHLMFLVWKDQPVEFDSLHIGFPVDEFACSAVPCPLDNLDGTVTTEPNLDYLITYTLWQADSVLESRLEHIISLDTATVSIPLDAPANLRIEQDSLFMNDEHVMVPVIRWDPSPQDRQGVNGTGLPANDPNIQGDEVYSVLKVYDLDGNLIPLDCNPFGECRHGYGVFENLHSWGIPVPVPDTIYACVHFEAWDCPNCVGPGGQIESFVNEDGNVVRAVPVSETTCSELVL